MPGVTSSGPDAAKDCTAVPVSGSTDSPDVVYSSPPEYSMSMPNPEMALDFVFVTATPDESMESVRRPNSVVSLL